MLYVNVKDTITNKSFDAVLECVYFNYIVLNINDEHTDKRIIISVFDQRMQIELIDKQYQNELLKLLNFVKNKIYDDSSIETCNCFYSLPCVECLFVHTKLMIRRDKIVFANKVKVIQKDSKFHGHFSYLVTNLLPIENNLPCITFEESCESNMSIKELLKMNTDQYKDILYYNCKKIAIIDLTIFFNAYIPSNNTDQYLLNESIICILRRTDTDFLNSFFIYLGLAVNKISTTPNFIRLLLDLLHLSKYRMTEIIIAYDLFDNFVINDNVTALYAYKLLKQIDEHIKKRYNLRCTQLDKYKDTFYHF